MRRSIIARVLVNLTLLTALVFPPLATTTASPAPTPTAERYSSVLFVENVGQLRLPDDLKENEKPRFQIRGSRGTFYFAPNAIWITLADAKKEQATIRLSFVGANENPQIVGIDRLATHVSYYFGNDPAQWHEDVPVWGGVRYENLYPGWDLEITSHDGLWEWQLVAKRQGWFGLFEAQADLNDVRLHVEGADKMALDNNWLRLLTPAGEFTLPLLQLVGMSTFSGLTPALTNNNVLSPFGPVFRPATRPSATYSQIDLLHYSTYLGGSDNDCYIQDHYTSCSIALAATVGTNAIAYISGNTLSSDFPRLNAYDNTYDALYDVFITKLNSDGSGILYSTYLGGGSDDYSNRIAVNGLAAHVVGWTTSSGFPTTPGAFDTQFDNSNQNPFVVKLSSTGTLLYSTFLGRGQATGVAVAPNGRIHVVGQTTGGFTIPPGMNVYDPSHNGNFDFFIAKLNPVKQEMEDLLYYTYFGGAGQDCEVVSNGPECDIALDTSGKVFVVGVTRSPDLASVVNGFDNTCGTDGNCNPILGNPQPDLFVAAFNLALGGQSDLLYSTYLGGSLAEECYQCAISALAGKIYVTGDTKSSNFPLGPNPVDNSNNGNQDAFVTLIDPSEIGPGSLLYSTYLGIDSIPESARDIWVAGDGTAYITGRASEGWPTTPDAFDTSASTSSDVFVTKLDLSLGTSAILYSTFLGGNGAESGGGVTGISTHGQAAYVTGNTFSSDFPHTDNAYQTAPPPTEPPGKSNAFVTKLAAPPSWSTSYYAGNVNDLLDIGIELGKHHNQAPGTQDEVIILAFGEPEFDLVAGTYGMRIYDSNDPHGYYTTSEIALEVFKLALGYFAFTDTTSELRIIVGASNQALVNEDDPNFSTNHGQAWANMVDGINTALQGCCNNRVIVLGGSDIEHEWSSAYNAKLWVEAYANNSNCTPGTAENGCFMNFGANNGFSNEPCSQDADDPWGNCDIAYISWEIQRTGDTTPFARPLPQIYRPDHNNAVQWQLTSKNAQAAGYITSPMHFVGTLTTWTACTQVPDPDCANHTVDNTPGQGWIQLWGELYHDILTRQSNLKWSTDIAWQCTSQSPCP